MSTTNNVTLTPDPASPGTLMLSGNPSAGGAKACFLRGGDSLRSALDATALPGTAQFTSITFYPNGTESSAQAATITLATGTSPAVVNGYRPNSTTPIRMFSVTWTSTNLRTPISIVDADTGGADDCAWFSIVVTDPATNRTWRLDPEIVNTGGTKSGWNPGEAATLARVEVASSAFLEALARPLGKKKAKAKQKAKTASGGKTKSGKKDGAKASKGGKAGKDKGKSKDKSKDKKAKKASGQAKKGKGAGSRKAKASGGKRGKR